MKIKMQNENSTHETYDFLHKSHGCRCIYYLYFLGIKYWHRPKRLYKF